MKELVAQMPISNIHWIIWCQLRVRYLHISAIGNKFEEIAKSKNILKALQQRGVKIDRFMDCLDTIQNGITLPDDLTIKVLILKIKDNLSLSHADKLVPIVHHDQRNMSHLASTEADDENSPKGAHLMSFVENHILNVSVAYGAILLKIVCN